MTFIAFVAIFLVGVGVGSILTILMAVRMEQQQKVRIATATARPAYIDVESWIDRHGTPS